MKKKNINTPFVKYSLNSKGSFVIENYNGSKPFSNFFPGIAGLWGIPMWVFYVNRGQCISSFGIESKDKAILEFQPANKAYRQTALQGFRTFVKLKEKTKEHYWEPFQEHLPGTQYKKKVQMIISAHDLTIEETNLDLGVSIRVNYFTLPEEPYSALVRRVQLKNTGKTAYEIEMIDGLPMIIPYGLSNGLIKSISRTVEAWTNVKNLGQKAPYHQLSVEISDKPQVTHIEEGNFAFCFDPDKKSDNLYTPIVEANTIFGVSRDFTAPESFFKSDFQIPSSQTFCNKTPSALHYAAFSLAAKKKKEIISLFGFAHSIEQINAVVKQAATKTFIEEKTKRNKNVIEEIRSYMMTNSSSNTFNEYSATTFLDNVLRGGLPISLQTKEDKAVFNVYSRKHGDLERDYNHFIVAPTFYSQGNGNYRDVNQNRRNDVWFNTDVKALHLIHFLNLIQADGYNPLVVTGTEFSVSSNGDADDILQNCIEGKDDQDKIKSFVKKAFLPGRLLEFLNKQNIQLNVTQPEFLSQVLSVCRTQEVAVHGEGYWSDHWTYNIDLIESYLALYPEDLRQLFLKSKDFTYYHNSHYVLPRDQRYILTEQGVRQYHSVAHSSDQESLAQDNDNKLKTMQGRGVAYASNMLGKLLCLLANKVATFDPEGIGIEMEADKPNWYDALNGLPGLLGSSLAETIECQRLSRFVMKAIMQLKLPDDESVAVYDELATFISGLANILNLDCDDFAFWSKANDIKEHYRQKIRSGIEGEETALTIGQIKMFLNLIVKKCERAIKKATDKKGILATYFYYEVKEYKRLDKRLDEGTPFVSPKKFQKHVLPPFLSGYVHALRVQEDIGAAQKYYQKVRDSQLFDKPLKMYKVNADLSSQSEEIGRARIFPSGWLENESVWLHMEYKFLLELIRKGLTEEFYDNFQNCLVPFLNPQTYGRSILENSSFIVSSAHEDVSIRGQGYIARLSGSTAEFIHIWLCMNLGLQPFSANTKDGLICQFKPLLTGWLFTKKETRISYFTRTGKSVETTLPKNTYAFNLLGSTLVVYHNPKRLNTFGQNSAVIKKIELYAPELKTPEICTSPILKMPFSQDVRDNKYERINIYFR